MVFNARKTIAEGLTNAGSPKRVVLLSNMRWKGMGQTNRQAWACALSDQFENVDVLFIETLGWKPMPQLRSTPSTDRIRVLHAWNLIPRAGRPTWWVARMINAYLTCLQILWTHREFWRADLVVTFDPLSRALVRLLRAKTSLYDCLDLYAEQPQYSSWPSQQQALTSAEQRLARSVTRVSVSAQPLLSRFSNVSVDPIYSAGAPMPLGVSPTAPCSSDDPGVVIRCLYVGALDHYKVDYDVFYALLALEPRIRISLIGKKHHASEDTDSRLAQLALHDRIEFHEPVGRDALAEVFQRFDFGIIAMRPSQYSDHSFPLKLWDYLEAGKPVIASGSRAMSEPRPGVVAVSDAGAITRSTLDRVLKLRSDYVQIHNYAVANSALFRVRSILLDLNIELS